MGQADGDGHRRGKRLDLLYGAGTLVDHERPVSHKARWVGDDAALGGTGRSPDLDVAERAILSRPVLRRPHDAISHAVSFRRHSQTDARAVEDGIACGI